MVTSFLTPAKLSCYSCCLVFLGSAVHFTHIKWYYSFTVLFLYSTFDYNYVLICEVIFNESDCQSILYSFHCIFCTGVCKRLSLLHTCFHQPLLLQDKCQILPVILHYSFIQEKCVSELHTGIIFISNTSQQKQQITSEINDYLKMSNVYGPLEA